MESDLDPDMLASARGGAPLVALLLQDSEDADGELEDLHGALVGAGDVAVRALDKALQKRGISKLIDESKALREVLADVEHNVPPVVVPKWKDRRMR